MQGIFPGLQFDSVKSSIFHPLDLEIKVASTAELIGPLNEVEKRNAPTELYFAGDVALFTAGARVSLVGSRKASDDGIVRTKTFAKELSRRGITVVSGLAEGIDTAAHTATIENGGRTIAVLGTPLDQFYPAKNSQLQKKIMSDHLCVSQFPVGSTTNRSCFPMRNRTMALISDATVIMEAQDDSGSLHQGWEALRLGRPLFIAKSITESKGVTWPEKFLHYGAQILIDSELDELIETLPPPRILKTNDAAVSF